MTMKSRLCLRLCSKRQMMPFWGRLECQPSRRHLLRTPPRKSRVDWLPYESKVNTSPTLAIPHGKSRRRLLQCPKYLLSSNVNRNDNLSASLSSERRQRHLLRHKSDLDPPLKTSRKASDTLMLHSKSNSNLELPVPDEHQHNCLATTMKIHCLIS